MFNYNKRNLVIISVILSLIILIFFNFILYKIKTIEIQKKKENLILKTSQIKSNQTKSNENEVVNLNTPIIENIEEIVENQYSINDWRILIPKINLDAPILEGTSQSNLRRGVGHFEETATWNGNVCLAAHNRGYKYNFFQQLKELEDGDIIEYRNGNRMKKYSVIWNGKIKETDLSYLQPTKDNILTLITCVENMPEYRVCVQACEIKTI